MTSACDSINKYPSQARKSPPTCTCKRSFSGPRPRRNYPFAVAVYIVAAHLVHRVDVVRESGRDRRTIAHRHLCGHPADRRAGLGRRAACGRIYCDDAVSLARPCRPRGASLRFRPACAVTTVIVACVRIPVPRGSPAPQDPNGGPFERVREKSGDARARVAVVITAEGWGPRGTRPC